MAKNSEKKVQKEVDVVAQDKDWKDVIKNELKFQENWQKDWGFLSGDGSKSRIK